MLVAASLDSSRPTDKPRDQPLWRAHRSADFHCNTLPVLWPPPCKASTCAYIQLQVYMFTAARALMGFLFLSDPETGPVRPDHAYPASC